MSGGVVHVANKPQVDTELAQPLTDEQLRATPVSVLTGLTQPITDTQLRASNVNIQIKDGYGFGVECTPSDELRTIIPIRAVGTSFTGTTIDTNFWVATPTNNATIAQSNNQILLSSSTTNNGSAILQTNRIARYVAGNSNRFRACIQLGDIGVAGNTRRWGIFNGTDGAYFELAGTTLSACLRKTNNRTSVAVIAAPVANAQIYEIYIQNLKVYFIVSGVIVATHNALLTTWTDTFHLPARIDNINSGSTTNSTISVRSATIYRLGAAITLPQYFRGTTAATTVLKYGPGTLHRVVLNNPAGNLITIVDNVTGTTPVIGVINAPESADPATLEYEVPFQTGLIFITTGTWDYTVIYE